MHFSGNSRRNVTASSELAVGEAVSGIGVEVAEVALLMAGPDDVVAAGSELAVAQAVVGVDGIRIVALFDALEDNTVATAIPGTVVFAGICVVEIAIVALFGDRGI